MAQLFNSGSEHSCGSSRKSSTASDTSYGDVSQYSSQDDQADLGDFDNPSIGVAERRRTGPKRPGLSYIALVSKAILSTPQQKMLLSEIYQWITENYPYYRMEDRSWRNSIRHNLSLNECFVKCGRDGSGKGHYWSIHEANVADFMKEDFRRRYARRRVRRTEDRNGHSSPLGPRHWGGGYGGDGVKCGSYRSYEPMTTTVLPTDVLVMQYGAEAILTRNELWSKYYFLQQQNPMQMDVS